MSCVNPFPPDAEIEDRILRDVSISKPPLVRSESCARYSIPISSYVEVLFRLVVSKSVWRREEGCPVQREERVFKAPYTCVKVSEFTRFGDNCIVLSSQPRGESCCRVCHAGGLTMGCLAATLFTYADLRRRFRLRDLQNRQAKSKSSSLTRIQRNNIDLSHQS